MIYFSSFISLLLYGLSDLRYILKFNTKFKRDPKWSPTGKPVVSKNHTHLRRPASQICIRHSSYTQADKFFDGWGLWWVIRLGAKSAEA
jgi:hypothetical protein